MRRRSPPCFPTVLPSPPRSTSGRPILAWPQYCRSGFPLWSVVPPPRTPTVDYDNYNSVRMTLKAAPCPEIAGRATGLPCPPFPRIAYWNNQKGAPAHWRSASSGASLCSYQPFWQGGRQPFMAVRAGNRREKMTKALGLLVALFALWLALSGYFKPFLLIVGFLSCLFTVLLARRMNLLDDEAVPLQLRLTLPLYWSWLGGEIFKSALAVSKIILSPRIVLDQQLIAVESPLKTDMGHVIFANSITLTPGTATVEAAPGKFLVHALTNEAASAEAFTEMARRVAVVETR
ncbi:MAG: hypothetical protein C0454_03000 [Parvibaculum sp.]|nr:hypothetical protein [Parvibaculum sp.]